MTEDGGLSGQEGAGNNSGGDGVNPAWNDLLGEIPSEFHEKVTPHLKNWDTKFNEQVGTVKSQYEPFQHFIDGGVEPEHLNMGLQLLTAIQNNPKDVYDLLAQQFNLGEQEKKTTDTLGGLSEADLEGLPPAVIAKLKEIDELKHATESLAQEQLTSREQKAQEEADARLKKQIADLKEKHGDFDEGYVLTAMHLGAKPDKAIEQWNALQEKIIREHTERQKAPKVLGGGSLLPGEKKIDVSKLDGKARRNYIAQLLAERHAEKQAN